MAKADLHVHSKHSNERSEWYLRRLGAPESFTEPKEVYRRCRERGFSPARPALLSSGRRMAA